jgi:hypothetical protein
MKLPVANGSSWPEAGTGERQLRDNLVSSKPRAATATRSARSWASRSELGTTCEVSMAQPSQSPCRRSRARANNQAPYL